MLSRDKTRLSVSGWFYAAAGTDSAAQDSAHELYWPLQSDLSRDAILQRWLEWINEDYLEGGVFQSGRLSLIGFTQSPTSDHHAFVCAFLAENIQQMAKAMEENSILSLEKFLRAVCCSGRCDVALPPLCNVNCSAPHLVSSQDKHREILRELQSSQQFFLAGPPDEAEYASLGRFCKLNRQVFFICSACFSYLQTNHARFSDPEQPLEHAGPTLREFLAFLCSEDFTRYLNQVGGGEQFQHVGRTFSSPVSF